MGKSKYLLVLPMALTMLTACGGGNNFKSIDYDKAKEIAENYVESIKASKAATIEVSGHVNKLAITGDFTWWSASYEKTKDLEPPASLFGMIPNFSFKNGEMNVGEQDIAKFSIPGSLMNVAESMLGIKSGSDQVSLLLLDNLPKFPMNARMLKLIHGVEISEPNPVNATIPWEYLKDKAWEKATTSFYSDNGRLKVTLETDDINAFGDEITARLGGDKPKRGLSEEQPKYPASFTLTTNNIGYIDSVSIKTKIENIDKETKTTDEMLFYYHIKGNLDLDITLNFKQSIASPITIKYLLKEYKIAEDDETVDVTYDGNNLHCKKIHPITSNLDSLKDYVSFDWYTNYKQEGSQMVENYDDPIFNMNYWHGADGCAKNVAFTAEPYDVMMFPTYTIDPVGGNVTPKYQILGAQRTYVDEETTVIVPSLISTSIDGRIISSDQGLPNNRLTKVLEPAADIMRKDVMFKQDKQTGPIFLDANELYINSNMLKANGSEYIISIAVLDLPQGE